MKIKKSLNKLTCLLLSLTMIFGMLSVADADDEVIADPFLGITYELKTVKCKDGTYTINIYADSKNMSVFDVGVLYPDNAEIISDKCYISPDFVKSTNNYTKAYVFNPVATFSDGKNYAVFTGSVMPDLQYSGWFATVTFKVKDKEAPVNFDILNHTADSDTPEECVDVGEHSINTDPNLSVFDYVAKEDGTIIITGYNGEDEKVTVPEIIDGEKVSLVATQAFDDKEIEVTLPETVKYDDYVEPTPIEPVKKVDLVLSDGYSIRPISYIDGIYKLGIYVNGTIESFDFGVANPDNAVIKDAKIAPEFMTACNNACLCVINKEAGWDNKDTYVVFTGALMSPLTYKGLFATVDYEMTDEEILNLYLLEDTANSSLPEDVKHTGLSTLHQDSAMDVFDYIIKDDGSMEIYGYNSTGNDDVLIPSSIDGINVSGVDKDTFKDTDVTKISFEGEVPENLSNSIKKLAGIDYTAKGDVNNDGTPNAKDALMILQYVAKLLTLEDPSVGDINNDGSANAKDALLILKYVAKLIPSLEDYSE